MSDVSTRNSNAKRFSLRDFLFGLTTGISILYSVGFLYMVFCPHSQNLSLIKQEDRKITLPYIYKGLNSNESPLFNMPDIGTDSFE